MALEKAKLIIEKESGSEKIPVQFNPAEYNLTDQVAYAEQDTLDGNGPITKFISRKASTLALSLTFDTYDTPENGIRKTQGGDKLTEMKPHKPTDVSKLTRKVAAALEVQGPLHRPPTVTFAWGSLRFKGVLTGLKQHFTMFLSDGTPVRARLELTLRSIQEKGDKRKSPFESPDRTKYRTVHEGENLWNFAVQEYGDADQWRVIAKENDLMNPLDVKPGQVIKLPAL